MNPERRSGLSLGQILGIPVRFHWSWLLVLGLVALSLTFGYFPLFRRVLAPSSYLTLGAVTAVLFCASLLAHELAHAVVARRERIAVRGITLFAFGGVAELADQPRTPGAELRMAAAGPLASLALAWLFSTLSDLAGTPYLALPFAWLAGTNLALGLFNLLPGFPLDGGRVLRAALWGMMGSLRRATRIAAGAGQLVSWGFVLVGLVMVLTGNIFNGLWLVLIATFLRTAAAAELAAVEHPGAPAGVEPAQRATPEGVATAPPAAPPPAPPYPGVPDYPQRPPYGPPPYGPPYGERGAPVRL
jgi:Zn-dependent protease